MTIEVQDKNSQEFDKITTTDLVDQLLIKASFRVLRTARVASGKNTGRGIILGSCPPMEIKYLDLVILCPRSESN